jgi:hypothetical protein
LRTSNLKSPAWKFFNDPASVLPGSTVSTGGYISVDRIDAIVANAEAIRKMTLPETSAQARVFEKDVQNERQFNPNKEYGRNMPDKEYGFFKPEDFNFQGYPAQMSINGCAAAIANRILQERGVRVYGSGGYPDNLDWSITQHRGTLFAQKNKDTHTALLIDIKPIEKEDTAEGLLKDIFDRFSRVIDIEECADRDWYKRAKAYLEKQK